MKRFILSTLLLLSVVCALAQKEYYTSVDGVKGGAGLKTALYELIKNHKKISYGSGEEKTWGAFYTTDAVIENGKRRVLDMYSSEKRYFGSKGSAVSGMNIEHSVPKSWWGGSSNNAYCDLHHLNPSDQNANSRKSNYPLGEITDPGWDNGVTFVGKANIEGSNINVFEPCDEYKGDFARTYMYMFTCYQDLTWEYTWMNYEKSTYPTLKPWAVELLLKWHKQDPVSEKEVNRNNAVYAVQGNRNPFIDYPQFAEYVWGDSIEFVFHLTGEVEGGTGGNTGGDGNGNEEFEIIDGWKIYLNENFDGATMKFTTYEGVGNYPWTLNSQYKYAIATSYVSSSKTNNDAESWLLSPVFDFSNDSVATVSFEYVIHYCQSGKAAEHHSVMISSDFDGDVENATWESIDFGATENTTDWTLTKTDDIAIPQKYMGEKAVTIAFFYKGTSTKAGTFEIDNVIVKAVEGANDNGNTGGDDNEGDNEENEGDGNGGNDGNFDGNSFVLVTDAAQLTIGDSLIIGYENYAMGASAGNYRHKTDIMVNDGTITYLADDVQIIVLEEGAVAGTYAFNVGGKYLAASSSSSNYLATKDALDANGSWTIVITDALATITAQGDKTRNILQYNTSAPRFSCYTGTQKSVNIYAKSPMITTAIEDDVKDESENAEAIYDLQGRRIKEITAPGIYIIGGKKVLVK
ncbi:MAG: endonuclease [Bacteroidaceae bacterium]|nr:endonuclease [Bacteroidaceae bacterium]